MKEKHKNVIQVILILILIICALIFKVIPEYQADQGSSDTYINTDTFTDIVEIKVNNKPNFALVITENKISNIIFFDQESLCLYNKDIETNSIKEGTEKIVEYLIENDYLKQDYFLILTKYNGTSYEKVKSNLLKTLNKLNVTINLQEESSSIKIKAKTLNITEEDEKDILKEIELYSKDIVRHYKNHSSGIITQTQQESISGETAKEYTEAIYKKIEIYAQENNIINQDKETPILEITKIPADSTGTLFPDETSWYYIRDSQVYAYISITQGNNNYSFCYQASIKKYKKGPC